MLTETIIEDERWRDADLPALAERAGQAALAHLGLDPALFEIAVLGCDDTRMAALNADFRGKPRATNVLSWPEVDLSPDIPGAVPEPPEPGTPDDPEHLGDVALAYETCTAEAQAGGTPLAAHVTHLVVHGVLHLLGYDHEDDSDAGLMERIEVETLGKLGLPDPYREREGR
ncbi:rRNA maturation RNase YbeY [Citreimonas salinaria]|uniref:Endoribonuclease YbeY n=1 Tax=Citreimonas salinaria TaxID=321339 RepID=A0A1H3J8I8_9RHOB|nr:rRNA maturation RNase YbeY [Citreimonas salinaria]SDY35738.1 probable rRNA maturation factor [Citreimonas salinaria]